ncbi:MAG: phosphoribosylformylglycinamidine synthase [Bacillota bacterium]
MNIKRIYVEKKPEFLSQANSLLTDLRTNLKIDTLERIRIINRYDVEGIDDALYESAKKTIFSEPNVDDCYDEEVSLDTEHVLAVEFLPGQYDSRANFAAECAQLISKGDKPTIKTAILYLFYGNLSVQSFEKIKKYIINPVESQEATLLKPKTFSSEEISVLDVEIISNFIQLSKDGLEKFRQEQGFAMTLNDLFCIQDYFKNTENRNPTITELKVIDTYWSDHCRHTTFMTKLENIEIKESYIQEAFVEYLSTRKDLFIKKDICLMDIATIGTKYLKNLGLLTDLDESDEINACSIKIKVDIDSKEEEYVLMFKNETHNHPTEIEPFGGAATCLGGAIRDPLSGRSYVYQAMRVTGAADPREAIEDTLAGKLPQRVITKKACQGYSSYGNQIGLATGGVYEIYHDGYKAKRMEVGAVIGTAPFENIVRQQPKAGDVILLLGGRTGRDGIGGATGSSKEQTEQSVTKSFSEVQKGNPVTERKIQRLFRNKDVTTLIKKCNDFGAGGVCVAVGELADSLDIDLDKVTKKYEGLDGTELAISESQERMAVVVAKENIAKFQELCAVENLEVVPVATVTDSGRLIMKWRGKDIFSVERAFLDTNGAKSQTNVTSAKVSTDFFQEKSYAYKNDKQALKDTLSDINVCSQKGLSENFDSTIGGNTVLMPFGGKNMITEPDGMVAKIPVLTGETSTCSIMTYGYNPVLTKSSTFHGGVYAIVESVAKVVALGGDYKTIRLSLQEYFERMTDAESWGKPFNALLGAFHAQKHLKIPAIGGKDSMSGTFKELKVPETIISFAVTTERVSTIISPELKSKKSHIILVDFLRDENAMPNFDDLNKQYTTLHTLMTEQKIASAKAITTGGILATLTKMALGNSIGLKIETDKNLIQPTIGAILVEVEDLSVLQNIDLRYEVVATTNESSELTLTDGESVSLDECMAIYTKPLEGVFPSKKDGVGAVQSIAHTSGMLLKKSTKIVKPKVFLPVFPGTNCEYDTAKAFAVANASPDTFIFRNLTNSDIEQSIAHMVKQIKESQIIALSGGFSAGDEPDGSAKFIASVFRNAEIQEAVHDLLYKRDGLMIGICNGFQALIKLGLLPKGEICEITEDMPTLTYNDISRHISCIVDTKICSNLSPWLQECQVGDVHKVAMSHGEGKFVANEATLNELIKNGQVATQYVDFSGQPTMLGEYNPNGSTCAIEGITSKDGRILGKMGHSERVGSGLYKNITGNTNQNIFVSGVKYFL